MTAFFKRIRKIRAYFSVFRIKTVENFQYRMAAFAVATVSIFYALTEIIVYSVFFIHANNSGGANAAISLSQLVTYVWMGQILFVINCENIESEIHRKIISGDIGIELCRPMDIYFHWFGKTAAGRVTPLVWRGIPILIAGLIMPLGYGMALPHSVKGFLLFLISVFCAVILNSSYAMLLTVLRVNIKWGEGPTSMLFLLSVVLSGAYLPLQLWPDFMQGFLLLQPFAGSLDLPIRIYMGTASGKEAFGFIAIQIIWSAIFIFAGKMLITLQIDQLFNFRNC